MSVARTGADGVASGGTWTLGTHAGTNTVTARASGSDAVVFTATVRAGPVARLLGLPDELTTEAGTTLPKPLSVLVSDSYGNAVSGATVQFSIISGGGSIGGDIAVSDAGGIATSGLWTLGASPGAQQAKAQAAGESVTFTALACYRSCRFSPNFLFVRDGNIFAMQLETRKTVQLTFDGLSHDPAWSPDGDRIAFARYDAKNGYDIYLMNPDGSGVVRRTVGTKFHSPAWSPDGKTLAVTTGFVYSGEIQLLSVVDTGGGGIHLADMATAPAWSPDGKQIAFVSLSGDDGYHALHVINADGSGISAVTVRDEGSIGRPSWSPDGKRIVFTKCIAGGCDLYSVSPKGGALTQLTQLGNAFSPAWSPDGTRIAFARFISGSTGGQYSLTIVTAEGAALVDFLAAGYSPAWRP